MNLKHKISQKLEFVQSANERHAKEYGRKLLNDLEANLKIGQTAEQNAGLIRRYKNIKPHGLSAMQQAFADAIA